MNLIIKKEEVRNSINAVIAIYGNTPKFLGVYALVGAVLSSNNFKVSIYINGYGYLIRLEGEVIKIASDFSPGNNALKKNPGS